MLGPRSLQLQNRHTLNLDLGLILQQPVDFNQDHCRIMLSHSRAVPLADFFGAPPVLVPIGNVNHQASYLFRSSSGCDDDRDYIRQRAIKLRYQIITDNSLIFIPANLAGNEEQPATRRSQNTVSIAARRAEGFGIDYLDTHGRCATSMRFPPGSQT